MAEIDDTKKEEKDEKTITQQDNELSVTEDVRDADYYHGLVPKIDIELLMKKDGDFLLRKTNNKVMAEIDDTKKEEKDKKTFAQQDGEISVTEDVRDADYYH
uniref:SH2 domain-containing protein n=1 Tax=Panagrolaimus sp. ES5 TaxID=591445 RepID=A0AC34GFP4_9BILA